jgi:hypothetical protein
VPKVTKIKSQGTAGIDLKVVAAKLTESAKPKKEAPKTWAGVVKSASTKDQEAAAEAARREAAAKAAKTEAEALAQLKKESISDLLRKALPAANISAKLASEKDRLEKEEIERRRQEEVLRALREEQQRKEEERLKREEAERAAAAARAEIEARVLAEQRALQQAALARQQAEAAAAEARLAAERAAARAVQPTPQALGSGYHPMWNAAPSSGMWNAPLPQRGPPTSISPFAALHANPYSDPAYRVPHGSQGPAPAGTAPPFVPSYRANQPPHHSQLQSNARPFYPSGAGSGPSQQQPLR